MTITAQTSKTGPYNGNGTTTVFSYTFEVQDEAHLVVTLADASGVETVQVLNTDYTVSGVGNPGGGQITMTTAPAASYTLTISRNVPITQEVDLENRRSVAPEVLEDAYDKLTQIAQDLNEQVGRSLKISVTESGAPNTSLQGDVVPGSFLGFGIDGNFSVLTPPSGTFISAGASLIAVDAFTGDGTTVDFTMGGIPAAAGNVFIFLDGVMQDAVNYSVSGTTLTFTTAPPLNTNIEVRRFQSVSLSPGATTADLVTYSPAGSGAQNTTVETKLREFVSVKDFGAVGDGVTDDTAAIQAAIDAAVLAGGGEVKFPPGKYIITDTIDLYNAGTPRGLALEGSSEIGGESGSGAGTIFEWQGPNDRAVFQALGNATRGLRFAGFLLMGAGTFGSPTNPYKDAFWIGPTSGFSAHKVIFEDLWIRDYTGTAFKLGDPDGSTYNGQMANSGMYNIWASGYLPDAKAIWAKGGTSEDFYIYNLTCTSMSGNDKKNFITTETGFYINIYGLLTDGIDKDIATAYAILAKSSVCVYQWITEDLRIYDTVSSAYGHPIVLTGVRQLSSSGTHGGIVRDAIVWRGYRASPSAWEDVAIMSLMGCSFNGNVVWSSTSVQSQMSAVGVNFAAGGFVYSGTNQRGFINDTTLGTLRQSGPSVSYEQLTEDGTSRFKVEKGAVYLRRNTLASISADQNDYALGTTGSYFRLSPTGAARTLTGIADGADGRMIIIRNINATQNLILGNESASSAAANRIVTTSGSDLTITPSKTAQLIYDSPSSRWIVINYY
jgi:hypothetical protein